MHHFGLIGPPGISHVTGLTGVARELCRRGHRATVFNIQDVEDLAKKEGMGFHALGIEHHPKGSFQRFADEFGRKHGLEALRFGLKVAREEIKMLLEEAPEAMRAAGVTALLIDQGQPAGSSIAERLRLPFITICNAVPCDPDPERTALGLREWPGTLVGRPPEKPRRLASARSGYDASASYDQWVPQRMGDEASALSVRYVFASPRTCAGNSCLRLSPSKAPSSISLHRAD